MRKTAVPLILFLTFLLFSCADNEVVTIAEQYGLAYAPLQIMREKAFFEELEPDIEIRWVKLGNTAAIREAVLAGEVDAGFMGIPPFLIGADKGMPWKLISGLSICPVGLVADRTLIPDFASLNSAHRIALPQPGSIQHILLSMAAERVKGDFAYYDKSLITMKHPDGMTALLSGAVDAHFTSPPYLFKEVEEPDGRYREILTGDEAFGGEFTFIAAMASDDFINNSPGRLAGLIKAIAKSTAYLEEFPEESAAILARSYDLSEEDILRYITHRGMKYSSEIKGLGRFIEYMTEKGYLSSGIRSEDLLLDGMPD